MNQRTKRLSSCDIIFEEGKSIYDETLKNRRFQGELENVNSVKSNVRRNCCWTNALVNGCDTNYNHSNSQDKNRNRMLICFILPFCKLTNINIGKPNLLDMRKDRDNRFRKIYNRNTVKIRYSSTKNMDSILNCHNRRLLDELNRNSWGPDEVSCNWRKAECSLGVWCNSKIVIYQGYIFPMEQNDDGERAYIGISTRNWKQGLYNHKHSFSNRRF